MAERRDHDKLPKALQPFSRALAIHDALPDRFRPSDETPLQQCLAGSWPTLADLRSLIDWADEEKLTVEQAWTILCETPDITSPEEYPDHALITMEQLGSFMARATSAPAPLLRGEDEAVEAMVLSLRNPFPSESLTRAGGIDRWREIMRKAYRAALATTERPSKATSQAL